MKLLQVELINLNRARMLPSNSIVMKNEEFSILKSLSYFLIPPLYNAFNYFGIEVDIMITFFWIMMADMVSGTLKSIVAKNAEGQIAGFKFARFYEGLLTKLAIVLLILLTSLLGKLVGMNSAEMAKYLMMIFGLAVGYSAINNFASVITKKHYEETDLVALVIDSIKTIVKSAMENLLSKASNKMTKNE